MTAAPNIGITLSLDELIAMRALAQRLRFAPRVPVSTTRSGAYASRFRGRGIDFEEVRAYQAGDDIRSMDWRVTARTGRPHTKMFHEERERPVYFAVDLGPSMRFGTRVAFKSALAARLAACLAWSVAARGDRVGGVVFDEARVLEVKPQGGHRGVLRLLNALVQDVTRSATPGASRLLSALTPLQQGMRPGSLLVIVSDFATLDVRVEQRLTELTAHNEVIAVRIFDALEAEPPPPGQYIVGDGLRQARLDTRDERVSAAYRARYSQHVARLDALFAAQRIAHCACATHQDLAEVLRRELHNVLRVNP